MNTFVKAVMTSLVIFGSLFALEAVVTKTEHRRVTRDFEKKISDLSNK
jgi:hypothetical protein